ncbi:MarR family winged helix-turn-helix transcriptional regulator [Rhizohabitans arisaemae]|uniref:MarR family winged helix-turn-helix transcriptional regulator n=1 Tax=Rhizohabitans arisaemae TaxID=2720610 RepID=UPI0024B25009|nr:MarR family transcriptional regulator [Rhizohabitans arisaemae]
MTCMEEVDAVELGMEMSRAMRAFTRYANARFAEHNLNTARIRLLTAVAENTRVRMGELADRLGVTARTVTALTDGLEKEGIVARKPDPADRRAFQLELTPKGQDALGRIDQLERQVTGEIFDCLNPAERAQLAALLHRVSTSLAG